MEKSQFDNYIDGVVTVYKQKEKKTDFSAQINPTSRDDLQKVDKFNYQELSVRNQDLDFAEKSDFSLSMKIKIRKSKRIAPKHMAVIDDYLYSIKHIDSDKKNTYLYLEGVRSLAKYTTRQT